MRNNAMHSVLCAVGRTADVVTTGAMWRDGSAYPHVVAPTHTRNAQLERDAKTFAPAGIRGSGPPG